MPYRASYHDLGLDPTEKISNQTDERHCRARLAYLDPDTSGIVAGDDIATASTIFHRFQR